MLILVRRLPADAHAPVVATLSLTAAERVRSRHRHTDDRGEAVYLNLPRGTVLRGQDLLATEDGLYLRVLARPESVLTVTAPTPLALLRAAYHLGNRHVPLEITPDYLRLEPDSVLEAMLDQMGVQVWADVLPFEPEAGAYGHSPGVSGGHPLGDGHSHSHSHASSGAGQPSPPPCSHD